MFNNIRSFLVVYDEFDNEVSYKTNLNIISCIIMTISIIIISIQWLFFIKTNTLMHAIIQFFYRHNFFGNVCKVLLILSVGYFLLYTVNTIITKVLYDYKPENKKINQNDNTKKSKDNISNKQQFIIDKKIIKFENRKEIEEYHVKKLQMSTSEEIENAGKFIGTLERLLMFIFIISGQYVGLAFVLGIKGFARYKDIADDPQFAEYFTIGTFLSFLFTVIVVIIVKSLFGFYNIGLNFLL